MSDFNVKFMNKVTLRISEASQFIIAHILPVDRNWCAGGKDVLNFFPLPVIG